jgi:hypothetical protein
MEAIASNLNKIAKTETPAAVISGLEKAAQKK